MRSATTQRADSGASPGGAGAAIVEVSRLCRRIRRMNHLTAIATSAVLLAGASALAAPAPKPATPPPSASADIKFADGKDVGKATLTQTAAGVRIRATLTGLPPG